VPPEGQRGLIAHEKVTDDRFDSSRVQKVSFKSTIAYGSLQFQQNPDVFSIMASFECKI